MREVACMVALPPTEACLTGHSICTLHPVCPKWLNALFPPSPRVDVHVQECLKLLVELLACLQSRSCSCVLGSAQCTKHRPLCVTSSRGQGAQCCFSLAEAERLMVFRAERFSVLQRFSGAENVSEQPASVCVYVERGIV